MEKKIHHGMEPLQDLMDKASQFDGIEVVPGDGFLMMSPVSLEHVRTFRHLTNVLDEQVDAAAGLEAVGRVDFRHPEWDTHNNPDVVLWTPVEDPQRDAQLIEFACEIVSPSSVENDYVRKVTAYAHAKLPVYLVLDPYTQRAVLFTRPDGGSYRTREEFLYGEPIELPLPSGTVRLDTGRLPVAPPSSQREAWPRHRTTAT